MKIPKMKDSAAKFHKVHEEQKNKAIAEHRKCKQTFDVAKEKGQWVICKGRQCMGRLQRVVEWAKAIGRGKGCGRWAKK